MVWCLWSMVRVVGILDGFLFLVFFRMVFVIFLIGVFLGRGKVWRRFFRLRSFFDVKS